MFSVEISFYLVKVNLILYVHMAESVIFFFHFKFFYRANLRFLLAWCLHAVFFFPFQSLWNLCMMYGYFAIMHTEIDFLLLSLWVLPICCGCKLELLIPLVESLALFVIQAYVIYFCELLLLLVICNEIGVVTSCWNFCNGSIKVCSWHEVIIQNQI